mmetsp:Transcript_27868/g.89878  ORF Transcript_27868/g.89878 Transcript_27868/m.89878 type:complete len:286 (-) Transcript_27868:887-1744(-)
MRTIKEPRLSCTQPRPHNRQRYSGTGERQAAALCRRNAAIVRETTSTEAPQQERSAPDPRCDRRAGRRSLRTMKMRETRKYKSVAAVWSEGRRQSHRPRRPTFARDRGAAGIRRRSRSGFRRSHTHSGCPLDVLLRVPSRGVRERQGGSGGQEHEDAEGGGEGLAFEGAARSAAAVGPGGGEKGGDDTDCGVGRVEKTEGLAVGAIGCASGDEGGRGRPQESDREDVEGQGHPEGRGRAPGGDDEGAAREADCSEKGRGAVGDSAASEPGGHGPPRDEAAAKAEA